MMTKHGQTQNSESAKAWLTGLFPLQQVLPLFQFEQYKIELIKMFLPTELTERKRFLSTMDCPFWSFYRQMMEFDVATVNGGGSTLKT